MKMLEVHECDHFFITHFHFRSSYEFSWYKQGSKRETIFSIWSSYEWPPSIKFLTLGCIFCSAKLYWADSSSSLKFTCVYKENSSTPGGRTREISEKSRGWKKVVWTTTFTIAAPGSRSSASPLRTHSLSDIRLSLKKISLGCDQWVKLFQPWPGTANWPWPW